MTPCGPICGCWRHATGTSWPPYDAPRSRRQLASHSRTRRPVSPVSRPHAELGPVGRDGGPDAGRGHVWPHVASGDLSDRHADAFSTSRKIVIPDQPCHAPPV